MMNKYFLLVAVLVAVLGFGTVKADDLSGLRAQAGQGNASAQWVLGFAYERGDGVDKDLRKAVEWYRKAAEQGFIFAQFNLGILYSTGQGVDKDPRQAVKWYRKAAEQGDVSALYNLSIAYRKGEGVSKDPRQEVYWLRKAAEQGHVDAQYNLSIAYRKGEGVSKDLRQEVYWLRKAAEQGDAAAQNNLGIAYSVGEGVVKDYRESYIWLLIAKASGNENAGDALRYPTPKLSASEIRSAQKEATARFEAIENRANESVEQNNFPNITDIAKPPATANIAQQVFEKTWRSVVVIETKDAQGSGVIVRPNIVATNCHVVDNVKRIAVYKSVARRADADNAFAARVRHADKRRDFCLLDVDGLWGIAATVRKYATLKVGESVYGLGAPKGLDLSLSDGLISQLREIDGNRKIQTNVAISPGSSGGGLFDREGNLIGIMTSKITDESVEGIGFAIPADLVLRE